METFTPRDEVYFPHCPQCGGFDVRFSSSPLRSRIRKILGSRRRFCAECGVKWHIELGKTPPSVLGLAQRAVIVGGSVLAGVLSALSAAGAIQP